MGLKLRKRRTCDVVTPTRALHKDVTPALIARVCAQKDASHQHAGKRSVSKEVHSVARHRISGALIDQLAFVAGGSKKPTVLARCALNAHTEIPRNTNMFEFESTDSGICQSTTGVNEFLCTYLYYPTETQNLYAFHEVKCRDHRLNYTEAWPLVRCTDLVGRGQHQLD